MIEPPSEPEVFYLDLQKFEAGALDLVTSAFESFGTSSGDLCSVADITIGNATDFPLTAADRNSWQQYLRSVKQLNWSVTYNFDDGAGNTESASESGTNYLAPISFDENSIPSLPGLEWRRRMLRDFGSLQLALRPDGFGSFYIVIEDAVSRSDSGGPISPIDLEIRFILFGNLDSFNRFQNVAHNSATGEYYPRTYISIRPGSRSLNSFTDSGNVAGTATVESLGSCNLYSSSSDTSVSFSATIASTF
jgi:hypothetical protein